MRALLSASFAALALFFGCSVEPPASTSRPDATVFADASTADASSADSGVHDCRTGAACGPEQVCARDGVCRAADAVCMSTDECALPRVCVAGSPARCADAVAACDAARPCPERQRCAPSGVCIPALVDDGTFREACESPAECGPGGVCAGGGCSACSEDRDCGRFTCFFGACVEPFTCTNASDCFEGNACEGGTCVLSTAGCTPDPANDRPEGAMLLREQTTLGLTLCGDDVDWHRVTLGNERGARIIVRSSTRGTAIAELLHAQSALAGDEVVPASIQTLALAGVTIFEVSTSTAVQDLFLRVRASDVSTTYSVDFISIGGLCAGDALDLYGDRTEEESLLVPPNVSLSLRACRGDVDVVRVPVERSDVWRFFPAFSGGGATLDLSVDGPASGPLMAAFTAASTMPLSAPADAAGEWTVSVSARTVPSRGQAYELELSRDSGPRLEACGAPAVIDGATTIDFGGAIDLGEPECAASLPGGAGDRIVRIDPPAAGGLLLLEARPLGGATATVSISLLSQCGADTSPVACDRSARGGGATAIEAVLTSSRSVYALVSALGITPGLQVEVQARFDAAGDYTCRLNGPQPIVASGERTVDTEAGTNTAELTSADHCGGDFFAGAGAGADRWFSISLGAGERAAFELTGSPGGFLWAGTDCTAMSMSCVGASETGFGEAARLVLAPSGSTNYLLAVDNTDASEAGTFTLRTVLRPQCVSDMECRTMPGSVQRCDDYVCADPPANDRCDGQPLVLTGGRATIEASTGAANDDFAGTGANCGGSGGQDVVYAIEVPAGSSRIDARIVRAAWDPILALRFGQCATAATQVACNDDPRPDPAAPPLGPLSVLSYAPVGGLAAGTYYLIVDAFSGAGPFTLEVEVQ